MRPENAHLITETVTGLRKQTDANHVTTLIIGRQQAQVCLLTSVYESKVMS